MENRKGQASMEFLMTYGWAILAAVLAIGVLAYYGVFSPGQSLPSICNIGAPLSCDEHQANATGVTIITRNGAGGSVTITNMSVDGCTADTASQVVANGATYTYYLDCGALTVGQKFTGNIKVTYTLAGKTLDSFASGKIQTEVR